MQISKHEQSLKIRGYVKYYFQDRFRRIQLNQFRWEQQKLETSNISKLFQVKQIENSQSRF